MTFAYGWETRRRVLKALANLRNFQGNDRHAYDEGLTGLAGPYRRMLGMRYGALPAAYAVGLDEAEYVVYCYGTPIAWVVNADGARFDGDLPRTNFMPDWQYSPTTTYYQGLVRQAWGDEKIVDPNPVQTARDRRAKRDEANARRREARQAARTRAMETGAVRAERGLVRGRPQTDSLEVLAARYNGRAPGTEAAQERTLAELLDPRYRNPDWVPGRDYDHDHLAEQRDVERVQAEVEEARRSGKTFRL